jgi:hypothetical protein
LGRRFFHCIHRQAFPVYFIPPFVTKEARHGSNRAGQWPVQLRFKTDLTGEQYVTQSLWKDATLSLCPLHPNDDCGFARHGTYSRVSPPGVKIARWYCRKAHRTFSLLPDCLASRLSGTLAEVERVVDVVEQASSLEAAADGLRPDIELPGAVRWSRRRVKSSYLALHSIRGLIPEPCATWETSLDAFRRGLGVDLLLPQLREIATLYLSVLPAPIGFRPPPGVSGEPGWAFQHEAGPDPPTARA